MATVNVKFLHTTKPRNSTALVATDPSTETLCLLKDATSVLTPSLLIQGNAATFEGKNFPDYNYCYIEEFHRYYFIVNIASISSQLWQLDCEVDVLATYRTEIRQTRAFIKRAQVGYNPMLADGALPRDGKCNITATDIPWDAYSEEGVYVLSVMGQTSASQEGSATYYVLNSTQMKNFCSALNEPSFWEEIKQSYDNPLDNIAGCVWLPMGIGQTTSTRAPSLYLGQYAVPDVVPWYARLSYSGNLTVGVNMPHTAEDGTVADYRNIEPYHEAYMYLVGVGLVQIPLFKLIKTGGKLPVLGINYTVDIVTGDIFYQLYAEGTESNILMTCKGNLATPIAISGSSTGALNDLKNFVGFCTGAVGFLGSQAVGNAQGMIEQGGGAVQAAISIAMPNQQTTHIAGSTGGRSSVRFNDNFTLIKYQWAVSDNPVNIGGRIGRPVMKDGMLSAYPGYVQCTGAYVKCNATAREHELIERLVNGGVLIE